MPPIFRLGLPYWQPSNKLLPGASWVVTRDVGRPWMPPKWGKLCRNHQLICVCRLIFLNVIWNLAWNVSKCLGFTKILLAHSISYIVEQKSAVTFFVRWEIVPSNEIDRIDFRHRQWKWVNFRLPCLFHHRLFHKVWESENCSVLLLE